ncbi:hypothetical protein DRN86_04085 [Candidatus Geothermarchaeota archaeon]|nr:MAG: hypothetical protein DRN86_04085 [Candidatus Geothermarchaeota archaeon]
MGIIRVKIEWEGEIFEFEGKPEEILLEIERFISKFIPTLSIAKKLQISLDLRDIAEIISPIIRISGGEIIFAKDVPKMSLSDKILAVLTAKKLLYLMGETKEDSLTLKEISELTSSSRKSSSSRLSELYSQRMVEKTKVGKVRYKVSINGIIHLKRKIEKLFGRVA